MTISRARRGPDTFFSHGGPFRHAPAEPLSETRLRMNETAVLTLPDAPGGIPASLQRATLRCTTRMISERLGASR